MVTNGARRFRRLMESGLIGRHNLSRVAVSLDTLNETVQDAFRGRGAWQDAMDTIRLLRDRGVLFDINVTGVRPVLDGIGALIRSLTTRAVGGSTCTGRRASDSEPTWPPTTYRTARSGITSSVWSTKRVETRPDFFVEIERGFLAEGDPLIGCALDDFSNLQILPDGRAYRCGLLVDQDGMASLTMTGDQLRLTRPGFGEELLRSLTSPLCNACPAMQADERRACIYDKVSSVPSG